LEEVGFKAIVFPLTDYIGKSNDWDINFSLNKDKHLSISQLKELQRNGWEIGSHGCHHRSYSGLKYSEIYADMAISKEKLEQILGREVVSFTAPFNMMVPSVFPIAEEIGYRYIFLQKPISPVDYPTKLNVVERRMVYRIDSFKNVLYKIENKSRFELYKENIIHFCANATIGVKELI
jgi:peptidoglycan/xylan/chitin deacetylase (PgdA/CDA1 family)